MTLGMLDEAKAKALAEAGVTGHPNTHRAPPPYQHPPCSL